MSARRQPVGSLGQRLSGWLALQSLVGLFMVSALVYAAIAWSLSERELEEMQHKREAIEAAFAEVAPGSDGHELKRRLDDFLSGHAGLSLRISSADGDLIYNSARSPAQSMPREMSFTLPRPADPNARAQVVMSMDTSVDDRLLRRLALTLALSSLLGAAAVSWTGKRLVAHGLAPVRDLSFQVEGMSLEQAGARLDGSRQPSELQALVAKFNALLARNERAYAQIEGFNADVAHELRTPLTTLVGASELALKGARPASELREVIGSNLEDLQRMSTIVSDMLFLSNADHGAVARREPVASLATMMAEIVDYHEAALHEAGLTATVEGDAAASVDAGLMRRAVSNLLSNATRHARSGSVVTVQISAPSANHIRVAVRNQGETVTAENLPRLFDRFFRVETSRQRSGPRHGLGLAIVGAIARMHGGQVFAESGAGLTTIGLVIRVP